MKLRLLGFLAGSSACLLLACGPASAQGVKMDDAELSETWGQALLDLTNTSQGGYDFSRITLNADITMSSNFTGLKLGTYTYGARNGTGSDIDISQLNFGRTDIAGANTVSITDPYFEWVYAADSDPNNRQIIGMRLGFGGITGDVGLQMNTVSGALVITDANGNPLINSANDTVLGGKRWDGLAGCASCTTALSQIGGVVAGNADGASRDFFISLLKSAVTWPTTYAGQATPTAAQSGFWMNWTDRLAAINTTGTVPPNVAKPGP